MKPFLFLGTRAEDEAADSEYAAMLRCSGLEERHLTRIRLERDPLGSVDLGDWSGVVLGGGPFNVSDPVKEQSLDQKRTQAELSALARRAVDEDFPFLGACYGIGILGSLDGGLVDRTHSEPIGCVAIRLSDDGRSDPLFEGMPAEFDAFLGHKEAVSRLPAGAVLLASSATCPVQAFRLGANVYATQFHPELDIDGLCTRIEVYREYGYFHPPEAQSLKDMAMRSVVTEPPRILSRFVEMFAR